MNSKDLLNIFFFFLWHIYYFYVFTFFSQNIDFFIFDITYICTLKIYPDKIDRYMYVTRKESPVVQYEWSILTTLRFFSFLLINLTTNDASSSLSTAWEKSKAFSFWFCDWSSRYLISSFFWISNGLCL